MCVCVVYLSIYLAICPTTQDVGPSIVELFAKISTQNLQVNVIQKLCSNMILQGGAARVSISGHLCVTVAFMKESN